MERITHFAQAGVVSEAFRRIPASLRVRVQETHFVFGNPLFLGMHACHETFDGRSYHETAHAIWSMDRPADDRIPHVVYPEFVCDERTYGASYPVFVLVHELGHVLDEMIGWQRHTPEPVSKYAESNTWEAFAEAFTLYCVPELCLEWYGEGHYRPDVLAQDEETLALFGKIAA